MFGAHPVDGAAQPVGEGDRLDVGEQCPEARVVGLAVGDVALAVLDVVALDGVPEEAFEGVT